MKIIVIILLFTFYSCSSQKKITEEHLVNGLCEKEFTKIKPSQGQKLLKLSTEMTGVTFSYLLTGVGYSSDFLISFTSGTVASVTVCSPLMALTYLSKGESNDINELTAKCLLNIGVKVGEKLNPELGKKTNQLTEHWRCPELDSISQGLRLVAACYVNNGAEDKAKKQYSQIIDSKLFNECLSNQEKIIVKNEAQNLQDS